MGVSVQTAPRFTTGTSKTRGIDGGEVVKPAVCNEKTRVSAAASTANGSGSSGRRTSQYGGSLEERQEQALELSPMSKKVL